MTATGALVVTVISAAGLCVAAACGLTNVRRQLRAERRKRP